MGIYGLLALTLDIPHLLRVVVVVRQRSVDVTDVETVPVGDRPRVQPSILDPGLDELYREPTPLDVGFVMEFPHDAGLVLAHHALRCAARDKAVRG